MKTVSIDSLVFNVDINCRATDRMAGVEALAASIKAHGLLNPIQVRPDQDGKWEVVDGNRRATAVKLLQSRGEWSGEVVEVIDLGGMTDQDARELSLAANVIREDIHPIDEFEAFARLAATMKPAEIAEHFGKTEKEVKQRLALGSLHPTLRSAWRSGEINADTAQAFTLCKDQAAQIDTYNRLKSEGRGMWGNTVRAALGMDWDARKALGVVGIEAYEAAGGSVMEDLFGDDHVLSDPDLAKRLLAEKLAKVCSDLVADGWGFAKIRSEVQNHWSWGRVNPTGKRQPTPEEQAELDSIVPQIEAMDAQLEEFEDVEDDEQAALYDRLVARRMELETAIDARRWGPRQKKQAGCFVYIDDERIVIERGITDPKAKKAAETGQKGAEDSDDAQGAASAAPEGERISVALNLALSEQLTKAAYDVLCERPDIALVVAVAALETAYGGSPAKIRSDGAPCVSHPPRGDAAEFSDLLDELMELSVSFVEARLSVAVAQSLDLRNFSGGGHGATEKALLGALPALPLTQASVKHFDAEHYFKSVNAALCNTALDEMGVDQKGRPKKKGELAEICVKAAKEHGWLPPQMRVPSNEEGNAD